MMLQGSLDGARVYRGAWSLRWLLSFHIINYNIKYIHQKLVFLFQLSELTDVEVVSSVRLLRLVHLKSESEGGRGAVVDQNQVTGSGHCVAVN